MSDRRLFINSRIDTAQVRDASRNLTFYGIEAARRYRERVNTYNPALVPLSEELYMRLALGKQGLPSEFRQEWRTADENLVMIMRDIQVMKNPAGVWKALLRKFQYARSMPSKQQALGFLNYTEARIQHLASLSNGLTMPSVVLASRVYVENTMIRGAFMASTFFIPVKKPNLN